MSEKFCLFAGTTEGRRLAEIMASHADLVVCVATEYGEVLLDGISGITVRAGRMDADDMRAFFAENGFTRIIDATHPYAELVTDNIRAAAADCGIPVLRVLREADETAEIAVYLSSVTEARDYLMNTEGNIFLTTGSKELMSYVGLDMSRVWARVLPTQAALDSCLSAGIMPAHIIAAQGPFSEELNLAQMRMINASYLVTKASGKNGGFEDKISAAEKAGAVPVIIGRPSQVEGVPLSEAVRMIGKLIDLPGHAVSVIGIGPGGDAYLTPEAREALNLCDAVIGADSVVGCLPFDRPVYREFMPDKIRRVLDDDPSIRRAAVVMRGDIGFFSGAKKLIAALGGYDVRMIPGVSSAALLAARLNVSWDDAAFISVHGRDGNVVRVSSMNRKLFALTGGSNTPDSVMKRLCQFGMSGAKVSVGEKLSYPDEKVTTGSAGELKDRSFDPLSIMYIENDEADSRIRTGIPDDEFIRGDTPMTKSEVRAVSVSKLGLSPDSIVYDIGAGTGSVSIECAISAWRGTVYAIEKESDAVGLIRENAVRFRTDNVKIVEGRAPDCLCGIEPPTHAFIGGSTGGLADIISALLEKNPDVRIVLNAVTVETLSDAADCVSKFGFKECDIVCVNVSRARKAGRYHMMNAQNPVYVITMQGAENAG